MIRNNRKKPILASSARLKGPHVSRINSHPEDLHIEDRRRKGDVGNMGPVGSEQGYCHKAQYPDGKGNDKVVESQAQPILQG
jgi:hypothetical protein